MKGNTPPIRLEIRKEDWEVLKRQISLCKNSALPEEDRELAEKLSGKIEKYSRDFTDEEGNNCKRVCFFESEASPVIWLLLSRLIMMEREGLYG